MAARPSRIPRTPCASQQALDEHLQLDATYDPAREFLRVEARLDGQHVGDVIASLYPDESYRKRHRPFFGVFGARIHYRDLIGCGIGTRLYEKAAAEACRHGYPLASDDNLSEYSRGFWEKQRAKGRAKLRRSGYGKGRYFLSCPAPESLGAPWTRSPWLSPIAIGSYALGATALALAVWGRMGRASSLPAARSSPWNLSLPVSPTIITSGWGTPRTYRGSGATHEGVDFRAAVGTPVHAVDDGYVSAIDTTQTNPAGIWMVTKHANGLSTTYGHLSRILVESGDRVTRGQVIARSGNTGEITDANPSGEIAPHLHVTLRLEPSYLPLYDRLYGAIHGLANSRGTPVPAEPLFPSTYENDVIANAQARGIPLYGQTVAA